LIRKGTSLCTIRRALLGALILLFVAVPGSEGWAGPAERGARLEGEHRLRSAAQQYESAIASHQGDIALRLRLGRILLIPGRWREAADLYRYVEATGATSPQVGLGLATALERLGEGREGLSALRRELAARPGQPEVWSRLVEQAARLGFSPVEIQGLLVAQPRPSMDGAAGQRVAYLEAACLLGPESADGLAALRMAASGPGAGVGSRALELLAAGQAAGNASGVAASGTGGPEARAPGQIATGDLEDSLGGSVAVARLLLAEGVLGPALADLEAVPEDGNAGAEALALRGYALMRLGRPEDAEAALRRSLELSPDQALGQHLLGSLLLSWGDAEVAMQWLERAVRREPGNPAYLLELGEALAGLGDYGNAEQAVVMAVAAAPDDGSLRLAAARFYVDRQYRAEAALIHGREAVRLSGRSAEALGTLGWATHLAGGTEDALKLLTEAVGKDPESATLRYRLAAVHEALGQREAAREQYEMVWELDGTGAQWKRAQAALEGLGSAP